MGNYSLSARAQFDLVGIYKYGTKMFGQRQATDYLLDLEAMLEELAERPVLGKDFSFIAQGLNFYQHRAHVVFYQFEDYNEIYVLRVLGKRMNFVEHF